MKLQLAALIATAVIAVIAAVFAIWPALGDAPWEDEVPTPVVLSDDTDAIRCEGALGFRNSTVQTGKVGLGGDTYDEQLANAEREIERYC